MGTVESETIELEYAFQLGKENEYGFPELVTCMVRAEPKGYDFRKVLKKGEPNHIERMVLGGVLRKVV